MSGAAKPTAEELQTYWEWEMRCFAEGTIYDISAECGRLVLVETWPLINPALPRLTF